MTKQDFKRIIYLDTLINSKLRQLEQLKNYKHTVAGISCERPNIQASGITDDTSLTAIRRLDRIADLDAEINADIDEIVELKIAAKRAISGLELQFRAVMEIRYLECKKWQEVADLTGYSVDHVYHLHGIALKKIKT